MTQRIGSSNCVSRASLALYTLLATVQCSLTVDPEREQCVEDSDCTVRGSAFKRSICKNEACVLDPVWACMQPGKASAAATTGPFVVRIPVVSVLGQTPVAGVTATRYQKIDADGKSPVGSPAVSDETGIITLTVEGGFDGFVTLTHATIGTSLYFFNPPVTRSEQVGPVRLASTEMAAALYQQVQRTFDPARGVVVLTAEDCAAKPLSDVSYTLAGADAQTQAFYSVKGLPTTTTTATDSSGYGGLIDVTPGTTAITARHEIQGNIGEFSLFVKAGTISYSRMVPSAQR